MHRDVIRRERTQPGRAAKDRWTRLVYDDVAGIDGDIEGLLGLMLERHGGTRATANAELVRALRSAA